MKRQLLAAVLFAGACALSATATQVDYSSSGKFTSTGKSSDTLFDYTGSGNAMVSNPFPTSASFGSFMSTGSSGSPSDEFVLTIDQTQPSGGSTILASDSFTGSITKSSSNVLLSFAGDGPVLDYQGTNYITFSISDIEYGLQEYTTLAPSSTMCGLTSLNGLIIGTSTGTSTPEPGSWALAGTGFLTVLMGCIRRKRRATPAK